MKGQSSIEYLATYGWAILVLLTVLSLLTYFGVIDLKQFAPDKCEMGAEFTCVDHSFIDDQAGGRVTLRLLIQNNLPDRIFIHNITCTFESENAESANLTPGLTLGTEDREELSCYTTNNAITSHRGKLKASYSFVYTKKDKPFSHEIDGTVFGPQVEV